MNVNAPLLLAIVALVVAIASFFVVGPLEVIATILLAVAAIIAWSGARV